MRPLERIAKDAGLFVAKRAGGVSGAFGFVEIIGAACPAVKLEVGAEYESGIVGELAALHFTGRDDDAVIKKSVAGLEFGGGPINGFAGGLHPFGRLAGRAHAGEIKETNGGRAVGAGVFRIVLVQSVPPDAAAKFVVPTTEDEASGFLGASEISPIVGELKGFKEGNDDPGIVVVILIVPVAAGRGRLVAWDGRFGVPVCFEPVEMPGEDGAISCRIMASGAEQGGESGGLA